MKLSRRSFMTVALGAAAGCATSSSHASDTPPNIILCMSDDQGWGDTGYNGHPILKTPYLDQMAAEGIQFDRFYAGSAACSPTRASCLTGRNPARMGITTANTGHMPPEEHTLADLLKQRGYRTGHFGKWHLGTLTTEIKDSNRGGPDQPEHYSPPWDNGFDVCFSTEAKVPTRDPMVHPITGKPYNTRYWTGPGEIEDMNLEGDDSRVIMDRAIPFMREAIGRREPFFAVIWFHSPHLPLVNAPEYDEQYEENPDYYGCITALDAQMGRMRGAIESMGAADNTMIWFCSDNGPERNTPGTTGPFRERKRSLREGGVRVPGLLVWPDRIKAARKTDIPACTSDYLPTILDALDIPFPDRPYDGISLMPLIDGGMRSRPSPIAFEFRGQLALNGDHYKIYRRNDDSPWELYDMHKDPAEGRDIAADDPDRVNEMAEKLLAWRESCAHSAAGGDYA